MNCPNCGSQHHHRREHYGVKELVCSRCGHLLGGYLLGPIL